MPLASGGFIVVAVVAGVIAVFVIAGYAIWTLRKDEGWEERPPPTSDE
jgi:hypothetical protein